MARAKTTREQWSARVTRWKDSGLTAAQYASEIGVSPKSLAWWRWRLASEASASDVPQPALGSGAPMPLARRMPRTATTISPLTFVEMTAAVETDRLEVVLPSAVRIRVRPGFDSPTLGRLLDVLEARR